MRNLIDSFFIFLLKIILGYLYRHYDFELLFSEKSPSVGDPIEDFEDVFMEDLCL